ncbi:hypothetical protein CRP7_gp50 [Roseobacter phage CRP-7]|nr:hypothetical protein CRP7_gp50 [Roseobacter phage CRP-7]
MAITYNWTIPTCEHDIATGGINVVHWRCTGVDGDNSASSYGTVGLTPDPSAADFVAYADVTEAQAQNWVWASVSQADTEAAIAAQINALANPTTAAGTPWAA